MSNAVFLIVAGVLLGPIEYGQTCVKYMQGGGCFRSINEPESVCRPGCEEALPAPTFAETCERAMREIGATMQNLPVETTHGLGGSRSTRYDNVWAINGARVLCIPAPSGLKR